MKNSVGFFNQNRVINYFCRNTNNRFSFLQIIFKPFSKFSIIHVDLRSKLLTWNIGKRRISSHLHFPPVCPSSVSQISGTSETSPLSIYVIYKLWNIIEYCKEPIQWSNIIDLPCCTVKFEPGEEKKAVWAFVLNRYSWCKVTIAAGDHHKTYC